MNEDWEDITPSTNNDWEDITPQAQPQVKQQRLQRNIPENESIGQLLLRNAMLAGQETYREGVSPILSGVSTALFGAPKAVINKISPELEQQIFPEQQSITGKATRFASEAAGYLGGGAAKLAQKTYQAVAKNMLKKGVDKTLTRAAAAMVSGGVAGGAQLTDKDPTVQGQLQQAGLSSVAGVMFAVGKEFPKVLNLGGQKTGYKIAQKADRGINKVGDYLSKQYDDFFLNVKGKTDPSEIISSIDDFVNKYPNDPGIDRLLKFKDSLSGANGVKVKAVSAEVLHNLKQELRKTIPKGVWKGTVDPDAIQAEKQNIYFKINDSLEKLGGDKYKGLSAEYRKFKESERLVNKMIYNQGVVSEAGLVRPIDVPTQKALRYFSQEAGDKFSDLENAIAAYRRGQSVKKAISSPLVQSLVGIGAAYGVGSFLNRKRGE